MTITWANAARHDVARIFDFNAAYDPTRATDIERRIFAAVERYARRPMTGRPIAGLSIREGSLPDIQYVVRYRIDADAGITILAVRHTRYNRDTP